jgi:hypothetical protein
VAATHLRWAHRALGKKSKRPIIAKNNTFAVHIGAKGVVNRVDLEVRLALSRPTGAADYPRLRRDLANVEVAWDVRDVHFKSRQHGLETEYPGK